MFTGCKASCKWREARAAVTYERIWLSMALLQWVAVAVGGHLIDILSRYSLLALRVAEVYTWMVDGWLEIRQSSTYSGKESMALVSDCNLYLKKWTASWYRSLRLKLVAVLLVVRVVVATWKWCKDKNRLTWRLSVSRWQRRSFYLTVSTADSNEFLQDVTSKSCRVRMAEDCSVCAFLCPLHLSKTSCSMHRSWCHLPTFHQLVWTAECTPLYAS